MALVFQYGSNCLERQINGKERLCGDAKFVCIAETVDDYRLAFDVLSAKRGCAASDIVASPGSKVWGVLYEVPDYLIARESAKSQGRKSLDAIEGQGKNYRRTTIALRRDDQQFVNALTYRVINPTLGLKTNLEYVGYIVAGLREHGIPEAYISEVKGIAKANNPDIGEQLELL
jgi:gamma-glutamylcyclotransferase